MESRGGIRELTDASIYPKINEFDIQPIGFNFRPGTTQGINITWDISTLDEANTNVKLVVTRGTQHGNELVKETDNLPLKANYTDFPVYKRREWPDNSSIFTYTLYAYQRTPEIIKDGKNIFVTIYPPEGVTVGPPPGVRNVVKENTYAINLVGQPQGPQGGIRPYVATFPAGGIINGNLTKIALPGKSAFLGIYLNLPKYGYTTDSCTDPNAVVRLLPGGVITGNDLTAIYGVPNPPLPIPIIACGGPSEVDNIEVWVSYTYS